MPKLKSTTYTFESEFGEIRQTWEVTAYSKTAWVITIECQNQETQKITSVRAPHRVHAHAEADRFIKQLQNKQ